jgi:catechol 2,3-dioxygenase-like lactoylglutathione lyase family enzyme
MEKSTFGHMVVNIQEANLSFYKDLFNFLGWKVLMDHPKVLGVEDENKVSLWFLEPIKKVNNDYDGIGMNHLAIAVPSQAAVDETVAYLQKRNIKMLFETPRHRPEFCRSEDETYFQVMFESPDRVLFEVVYTGLRLK